VTALVEPVSRRSANLPYLLWMLAFNLHVMLTYLTADVLLAPAPSRLVSAVNTNQLAFFLLV
jgi:hypothetical protein